MFPASLTSKFWVSIRSPYRSKGRPEPERVDSASDSGFNPLPLPKQGETLVGRPIASQTFLFQSAPLTEARGDPVSRGLVGAKSGVSIRSPYRSKGRPNPVR